MTDETEGHCRCLPGEKKKSLISSRNAKDIHFRGADSFTGHHRPVLSECIRDIFIGNMGGSSVMVPISSEAYF